MASAVRFLRQLYVQVLIGTALGILLVRRLAATLTSVGHLPVAAIASPLGIDRFMGEARAVTSLMGNVPATVAVAAWQEVPDHGRSHQVFGSGAQSDILSMLAMATPRQAQ